MPEFLVVYNKTLDYGGFQFCLTVFIRKVLESTGMEHCNGLSTPTNVEAPLGTDVNDSESNRDWPNSYAFVIWMMFIWYQTQDQIYHLLFTSVLDLHISPSHHTKQL